MVTTSSPGAQSGAPARRSPSWRAPAIATVALLASLAACWWLAVPRHAVCPAIYPAPAGCSTQDRQAAAVTWTVVLVTVYALVLATTATVGRGRRWVGWIGVVLMAG